MKSKYFKHIEYINPRLHITGYWGRIILTIIFSSIEFYIFVIAFIIAVRNQDRGTIVVIFLLSLFLPYLLFLFINDTYRLFHTLHKSLEYSGKIVMSREYIAIVNRGNYLKKLYWKDIVIIEKSIEDEKKYIIFITNTMNDRVIVLSDKKKNYIKIKAKDTLEAAARRFSGKDITIADPNINRFIINS